LASSGAATLAKKLAKKPAKKRAKGASETTMIPQACLQPKQSRRENERLDRDPMRLSWIVPGFQHDRFGKPVSRLR
jgi:hypothetical protein